MISFGTNNWQITTMHDWIAISKPVTEVTNLNKITIENDITNWNNRTAH